MKTLDIIIETRDLPELERVALRCGTYRDLIDLAIRLHVDLEDLEELLSQI